MAYKVAINGFGRIGRLTLRKLLENPEIDIVAINDIYDANNFEYLLKCDSAHVKFPYPIKIENNILTIEKVGKDEHTCKIPFFKINFKKADADKEAKAKWKELGIDLLVESTGVFREKQLLKDLQQAGAKKILLSVPSKDEIDATIVIGVNDDTLKKEDELISNASCTTNCLAPLIKILHNKFKIKYGHMTTVHSYTSDQKLLDAPHSDPRRARSAAVNIIPTSTGERKAVGIIIPELEGKLNGMAMRVPVVDGSVVDLVVEVEKATTAEEINEAFKTASKISIKDGGLEGILEFSTEPLVSTDIIGNTHSSIFDSQFTKVNNGTQIKVISWYDNEFGYVSRLAQLADKIRTLI